MKDALHPPRRSAPLRVLVTSYRSHPHVGGQGVYVRELTRALAREGCAVTVASGPPYPELDEAIALERLPSLDLFAVPNAMMALRWRHLASRADLHEWAAHNTGAFGEMTAYALRLEAFMAARPGRFDIIHDNQTLALPLTRIARRTPVITTLHHPIAIDRDFAVAGAATRTGRILSRRWHSFVEVQARAARRLEHFLCVSHASRDAYAQRCGVDPARVTVAHNGIDHAMYHPDPAMTREGGLIVTLASADVPIKGLDVLIGALETLKREGRAVRLTVIGQLREGPAKRALERAGLMDQVSFVSGLTREAIADLYRRCTVFVSASRFEGFGFPAAEAMACGAPVIVSDGGALPEVAGDAGLVTPAGDSAALAGALGALLDNPRRRAAMGQACADRARTAFRWEDHARAAIALYDKALSQREGARPS